MYTHILVPTDGSELSNAAIRHAVALAKSTNAKLTVMTVSVPYKAFALEPRLITTVGLDTYQESVAKLARQNFDAANEIASASDISCDTVCVEQALPYQAIIDTAKNRGCDLIVMASHGRRGIASIVLGSETIKVLTHSTVPVLVVRPPHGFAIL